MERAIHAQHMIHADNGAQEGEDLAAAVGGQHDIVGKQDPERRDIARMGGGKEGMGDAIAVLPCNRKARPGLLHMPSAREASWRTAARRGNLVERLADDIARPFVNPPN